MLKAEYLLLDSSLDNIKFVVMLDLLKAGGLGTERRRRPVERGMKWGRLISGARDEIGQISGARDDIRANKWSGIKLGMKLGHTSRAG
ncbi:unnamed protein product [Sphenostylis stenocarpa]|uniref:Uncharacterized protein n=1 Tax=Sphenostylis stenocarpa TaxID=92480 RepID=A0AA86VQT8_9FABA|nr:unnamed protein product [Sphenostylis stenocarpa]